MDSIVITKEEIEDIQEIVKQSCRPQKYQVVWALAKKIGDDLCKAAYDLNLTPTEMIAVADVMTETLALSVDKYEEMMYDFFHDAEEI